MQPDLVRELCQAHVGKIPANTADWRVWVEDFTAFLEAVERAGYRVVPARSVEIPLRNFKEAARG